MKRKRTFILMLALFAVPTSAMKKSPQETIEKKEASKKKTESQEIIETLIFESETTPIASRKERFNKLVSTLQNANNPNKLVRFSYSKKIDPNKENLILCISEQSLQSNFENNQKNPCLIKTITTLKAIKEKGDREIKIEASQKRYEYYTTLKELLVFAVHAMPFSHENKDRIAFKDKATFFLKNLRAAAIDSKKEVFTLDSGDDPIPYDDIKDCFEKEED